MEFWMLAVAAPQPAAGGIDPNMMNIIFIVGMVAIFWFFMIGPQRKQQKQLNEMLKNLKKGDKVITIGGLHGEIIDIDEDDVKLRVSDKTELKFTKSSVAKVKS